MFLSFFFALNYSGQVVHAQVSDIQEKEKVTEGLAKELKNLERVFKNISQLIFLNLEKFANYIAGQVAKEQAANKEIKKSEAAKEIKKSEAAKGLAKVEAEIKVEEALLAYIQKDYKTAYKLLSPIAEQGNDKAQYKLGIMYNDGQGVPQDYKEAGKWFRLAAEQENHKAELSLGFLYKDGKGVTKDSDEAMKLFTLAAEGGIPLAQQLLGLLLQAKGLENVVLWSGPEVEKEDYILAHKWLNLSISNFDARTQSAAINSAKKTRSEIEKRLTPSQIEEAQKLAKEWMESHSKEEEIGAKNKKKEAGKKVTAKVSEAAKENIEVKENIKAKQQEDYEAELFPNAEKERLAAQKRMAEVGVEQAKVEDQVRRKEKMRNSDDTSNSNLAKSLLSYQHPQCGNYTFIDLLGDRLINRKWKDVQHKNFMNKKLVMLNTFDTHQNKNIEVVFEMRPDGSFQTFNVTPGNLYGSQGKFALIFLTVVMEKCR